MFYVLAEPTVDEVNSESASISARDLQSLQHAQLQRGTEGYPPTQTETATVVNVCRPNFKSGEAGISISSYSLTVSDYDI